MSKKNKRREKNQKNNSKTQALETFSKKTQHNKVLTIRMPVDRMGHAGSVNEYLICPKNERDSAADQTIREFNVLAVLGKRPHFTFGGNLPIDNKKSGSSFIFFPDKVESLRVSVGSPDSRKFFTIYPNDDREASSLEYKCLAKSRKEALELFDALVTRFLSNISFTMDIPIYVIYHVTEDRAHNSTVFELKTPHTTKTLAATQGHASLKYAAPLFDLYRDAICNDSPFYKLLCFYKILEGCFRNIAPAVEKFARTSKIAIKRKSLIIENSSEIPNHLRDYVGKKVQVFFEEVVENQFRHAVAHYLLTRTGQQSPPLRVAEYGTNSKYEEAIFMIKSCARDALLNCVDLLNQIPDAELNLEETISPLTARPGPHRRP